MKKQMRPPSDLLKRTAILGALSFFLAAVEYMVPKPVPFFRLGLANFPILLSLYVLPMPHIFLLVLLKTVGQGLIQGTLFSYTALLSFSGSFTSAGAMVLLAVVLRNRISLIGLSVAGALGNNLIQLLLAKLLITGEATYLIVPPFLIVGFISSIVLGILARRFVLSSLWVQSVDPWKAILR